MENLRLFARTGSNEDAMTMERPCRICIVLVMAAECSIQNRLFIQKGLIYIMKFSLLARAQTQTGGIW